MTSPSGVFNVAVRFGEPVVTSTSASPIASWPARSASAHLLDKASPKLYDAVCTGKHIKEVILELCRSGGDKMKYMEIKLEQVLISRVAPYGAAGDGFPTETLSLSYGKIKWAYTQQKRKDGAGGGNVSAGWDLTTNRAVA